MPAISENLYQVVEQFQQSRVLDDLGDTMKSTRQVAEQVGRIADRAERGPGLAHALIYEEPVALRRVNDLITSTQAVIERMAVLRAAGLGFDRIAAQLNTESLPTRTGGRWHGVVVNRILTGKGRKADQP